MSIKSVEERLQRLEEQNERILRLLEEIAASSFSYKGKKLPEEKPDFPKIETTLRATLAEPENAALFALDSFETREWICEATILIHTRPKDFFEKLVRVVKEVSTMCGIPGRVSGAYLDSNDPPQLIGDILQFGYSTEVGYDLPNEFYVERKK